MPRMKFEDLDENMLFELITVLSLARNALVNDLYVIGLFVGPCRELKETEFAIQQIDRLLRPTDIFRS